MAAKPKTEIIDGEIVHLESRADEYFDDNDNEPDVFARIKAFCDSGEAAGKLGIYRAVPNTRKENFICNVEASDFSPENIKNEFGGGDYIIKAYDDRSKIRLKQHLSIEGDPIIQSSKPVMALSPYSAPAPALDIQALMQAMQESNKQMLMGLAQILQPQQNSRADMLAELATMRDIFGPPQQNSGADPMTMLIKGIELAGNMAPKVGGETSGMDVLLESIKSFAPAIGAVVAQATAKPRTIAPQRAQPQAPQVPQPAQLTNQTQPEIPQTESEETMLMKYYISMLVGFAKENRDPALYADLIADQLDDEKINDLLSKPDIIAYLTGINPDVATVSAWFEALILELKVIMGLTEPVMQHTVSAQEPILVTDNATSGDANNQ